MSNDGGRIDFRDPRMSRLVGWGMGILSTAAVLFGSWAATTLLDIKDSVTAMKNTYPVILQQVNARLDHDDTRNDRQDDAIGDLRNHVSAIEGTATRGPAPRYKSDGNHRE